jgi:hypothetical protein
MSREIEYKLDSCSGSPLCWYQKEQPAAADVQSFNFKFWEYAALA